MSNRQARRQQSRQARRQATSYRGGGRSGGSSQGSGSGDGGGGGGGGINSLDWRFIGLVAVIAIAAIVVVFVVQPFGGDDDEGGAATGDLAILNDELAALPTEMQSGNKLGSDDAPVKMIQYEDFLCPHCLSYTVRNEGFLIEQFVKPGLLQIEFRHLPVIGDASVRAAVGASCAANQNRLFEYANRLFAIQAEHGTDSALYEEDRLVELAGELGLDTEAFATCQAAPDALSPVANDIAAAQAIGFRGTPSFVINGTPLQNPPQSNERWAEIIQGVIDAMTAEDEADEGEADAEGEPDAGDDDGS